MQDRAVSDRYADASGSMGNGIVRSIFECSRHSDRYGCIAATTGIMRGQTSIELK